MNEQVEHAPKFKGYAGIKKTVDQKFCPICETWFERPSGKSNKVWDEQECCGRDCSAINRRKEQPVKGIKRRVALIPGNRRYQGWSS